MIQRLRSIPFPTTRIGLPGTFFRESEMVSRFSPTLLSRDRDLLSGSLSSPSVLACSVRFRPPLVHLTRGRSFLALSCQNCPSLLSMTASERIDQQVRIFPMFVFSLFLQPLRRTPLIFDCH